MATRCLWLGEGQVDILCPRQSASQLASCNWPANQPCDKISTCQASDGHIFGSREGQLEYCLIGSQPASLWAATGQPCGKISTCQALGWSDIWWQEDRESNHIGPQSRVPALQLVPLGEWPTWPRAGKWHKWALQPVIYLWHYIWGSFAVLYLCCLIIYSCMQCKEMFYRLSSLQTNLHISFHHQSDVLLHQVLLLRNYFYHQKCYEKKSGKGTSDLWSTRQNCLLVLPTRWLYFGDTSEHRSTGTNFIWVFATRCLYWGVHLSSGQADLC